MFGGSAFNGFLLTRGFCAYPHRSFTSAPSWSDPLLLSSPLLAPSLSCCGSSGIQIIAARFIKRRERPDRADAPNQGSTLKWKASKQNGNCLVIERFHKCFVLLEVQQNENQEERAEVDL